MNIISLNTWGGILSNKLLDFLQAHKETTDIFSFQEIYNGGEDDEDEMGSIYPTNYNLLLDLQEVLSGYNFFFVPYHKDYYGLAIFVKGSMHVLESGSVIVYEDDGVGLNIEKRLLQFIVVNVGNSSYTILNFHGISNEMGRNDSEARLTQSQNIIEYLKHVTTPLILCGDFNLSLDTESIKMIEKSGLRNLIRESSVTSTRTSYYKKSDKYADYIFVSDGIEVENFQVLQDEVSDHSPLLLSIAVN